MIIYKGLFFLVSGTSAYVILLLSLRLMASKNEDRTDKKEEDYDWKTKEELEIVDIISETHDIKSFYFKRKNKKSFYTFSPGQFLSFQIKDDHKLLRSYSISGSCENTSTLQVSIKKLNDGQGSQWFHQLNIGDSVWAFPPGGLFTDDNLDLNSPRVYIGGGIGITPLISMIKTNIDRSCKAPMSLFYGMRSTKDLAFHKELVLLSERHSQFSYFPLLSDIDDNWEGQKGYITYDFIKSKVEIKANHNFYFCGPPVLTDSVSEKIVASGHDANLIHSEKFASPVAFDPANISNRKAEITVDGQSFTYEGKSSILEFLEDNHVNIDFACRSGVCGACKCKLLKGDVDAFTDSGLTASEIKDGYFLSCVSRPTSDLEIKI
ncbi:MAG: iron-sulfur cluster-binding domain-containing protein [Bdellovibrionaceae bacterium]|jgi:ferredoxin-NADP reductase|nr:iron-sulfur cluster-binding domain-containing protein [Pseudobdellovibrionaceae bacterium]